MTNAVEIRDLGYRAGRKFELKDLNLHVPTGSIYGFLGPNGAGKTTTMRLIVGLLRPLSGSIRVLGLRMPDDAPAILARLGYVPEQPHLDVTMTVREILRFQAAFYASWDASHAETLLTAFQLDEGNLFGRLSKGQKAKVMILLALAQRPELLILDEPTEGLDPVVRRDILAALVAFVSQRQATVLISSHLVHELERICDWIGLMDEGKLLTEVPITELKSGIKRLRVSNAPRSVPATPFTILNRESTNGVNETWTVRGWKPEQSTYFDAIGGSLMDVVDLDLEDGFVELLGFYRRSPAWEV